MGFMMNVATCTAPRLGLDQALLRKPMQSRARGPAEPFASRAIGHGEPVERVGSAQSVAPPDVTSRAQMHTRSRAVKISVGRIGGARRSRFGVPIR
eukprot:272084-Prymnesium_polylepis.1